MSPRTATPPASAAWTASQLREAIGAFSELLADVGRSAQTQTRYADHATRFVNWLEGNYSPQPKRRRPATPRGFAPPTRSKYQPLRAYLEARSGDPIVQLTFGQIEDVLGFELPLSARRFHHWWANSSPHDHPQAAAWLFAGRRVVELDLAAENVMFLQSDSGYRGGRVRYTVEQSM